MWKSATGPRMMRRRSTEKDPNATVRVLRCVAIFGLLLPVFLVVIAAWIEHSNILASAERDGTKIVALFREQAASLFSGHENLLDTVVNFYGANQFSDVLHELEIMDKRLDDASEILLVDAGGAVLASTNHARTDPPPFAPDRKCFLALSKNEVATCISQPHNDPRSGVQLFSLSRRIDQGGAFSGIVQVAISADYIINLLASSARSGSDIVTMFTSDGTVLAQGGLPQAGASPPDVGQTLINIIGQSAEGFIRAPLTTNGEDRITVYAMLPEHPVYVSLSLAKSEILKKWYFTLMVYGVIAGCFMAGLTSVFDSLPAVNRQQ